MLNFCFYFPVISVYLTQFDIIVKGPLCSEDHKIF